MNLSRRQFVGLAGAASAYSILPRSLFADPAASTQAFTVGDFKHVYDPSLPNQQWYINDHTIIRADDGTWHMFGITHAEPPDPLHENFFAHATAPALTGPWTKQEQVLPSDPKFGETLMWAPHIVKHGGLYYMYYCGGGADHTKYRIDLATSKDLYKWERSTANPMVIDGFDARDPMILKVNDLWIMYYCATSTPQGGNHNVKALTSRDLLHWENPQEVFRSPTIGSTGGPTESPFVVYRDGKYYLFVCGKDGYKDTPCYVSDSPMHWDDANQVGTVSGHCVEIIATPEGKWYASAAGWGGSGLYLADLTWKP